MNVLQLANQLHAIYKEHGNVEVMFADPNSGQGPFSVGTVNLVVAEEGEYPEDWNMPEGFTFVELNN